MIRMAGKLTEAEIKEMLVEMIERSHDESLSVHGIAQLKEWVQEAHTNGYGELHL